MCGNFGRETWRKPWKLRSTGVAVIKTSRRKSTELRLTVIARFAVMFYLRSKPVCLINRRDDRPSNLHRVAWKFDEFQSEFKDVKRTYVEACSHVFDVRFDLSILSSVNLRSGEEQTHVGRVMGDGACLRSNVLHSFRGNLYSNCQIRHTSLSASCGLDVAAKRWTRVEHRSLTQPFMEMFVLWYRRFCWVSRKGNDFLLIYSRLPFSSPYLLGPDYEIGSLASRDNG